MPAQTVTDDPAQIRSRELALASKIRLARNGAKQGAIFTRTISVEFRRALLAEMSSDTRETLRDDNPGAFSHAINGTYPKTKPFSTVPINILAALPRLPDDIEYRFVGRHLVLHDTRANHDPRSDPMRSPRARTRRLPSLRPILMFIGVCWL